MTDESPLQPTRSVEEEAAGSVMVEAVVEMRAPSTTVESAGGEDGV